MDYTGKESTSISLNGLHLYADVPLAELAHRTPKGTLKTCYNYGVTK